MKMSRFFSVLLFVSLLFVLLPATAKAIWEVPVGPGESFRWVFVTSTARDAISDEISVYNTFVNDLADDASTQITGVVGITNLAEIEWSAIASTPYTDAIDNIGASPASIYTPMGTLVANGTNDMFDGFLHSPIMETESGGTAWPFSWTGSGTDGRAERPLGRPLPTYGCNWSDVNLWINADVGALADLKQPFYAISEELTAIPAPSAILLGAVGTGLVGWLRRCRTL